MPQKVSLTKKNYFCKLINMKHSRKYFDDQIKVDLPQMNKYQISYLTKCTPQIHSAD